MSELLARAQALRHTAEAVCRHMEALAEQMDGVAGKVSRPG